MCSYQYAPRLAWHETLELHELVTMQTNHLITLKMNVRKISDPTLRQIYMMAIQACQQHIRQLLPFYPYAATVGEHSHQHHAHHDHDHDHHDQSEKGYYAGNLLAMEKTSVRSTAAAITETTTPMLRQVLTGQLMDAIHLHATIFNYMYQQGMYPSHDLNRLLSNDLRNARRALAV